MIHGLRVRVAHLLHRDVGCAVANLAARDVSVLDDDDGMLGMLGSHVVDHDLAAAGRRCPWQSAAESPALTLL